MIKVIIHKHQYITIDHCFVSNNNKRHVHSDFKYLPNQTLMLTSSGVSSLIFLRDFFYFLKSLASK